MAARLARARSHVHERCARDPQVTGPWRRWDEVHLAERWPSWRRDVASLVACMALAWFGLVAGDHVPLLSLVDLGFHELGHLVGYVVRPPELVVAALGSFTQVAVPLGLAGYFLWLRHDRPGASVCLAWTGTSASGTATYVADAPTEQLPLIGGEHDWAFILGPDGLDRLDQAATWAAAIRGGAWLCVVCAVVVALWPVLAAPRRRDHIALTDTVAVRAGRLRPRI